MQKKVSRRVIIVVVAAMLMLAVVISSVLVITQNKGEPVDGWSAGAVYVEGTLSGQSRQIWSGVTGTGTSYGSVPSGGVVRVWEIRKQTGSQPNIGTTAYTGSVWKDLVFGGGSNADHGSGSSDGHCRINVTYGTARGWIHVGPASGSFGATQLTISTYTPPAPPTNTVTYHANGGSGSATQTVDRSTNFTTNNGSGFSRTGHRIIGWNSNQTRATAGTVGVSLNSSHSGITSDLTLYAVWQRNSYTVTGRVASGTSGSISPASGTVLHGDSVVFTASPAAGWHVSSWSGTSGTTSGTGNVTRTVTNATAAVDVTVTFARNESIWNPATALAEGTGGASTTRDLTPIANGVGQTFTYARQSGTLPAGLSLSNTNTGNANNTARLSGTLDHVAANTDYTFTVRATSSNGNTLDRAFTMRVVPQTYAVTYNRYGLPANHNGGALSSQISQDTKVWGNALTITESKYTVANGNWEQIGWTTVEPAAGNNNNVLNHRNFATTGTTSATLWVPNGTSTWGAGISVTNFPTGTITWSSANKTIVATRNEDTPLYPVWAPRQTTVSFQLGTVPPGSGKIDISGSLSTLYHLTHQAFTFPGAAYVVETGAIWKQIGWTRTLDIHARVVRPLEETLPSTAVNAVPNGHSVLAGTPGSNDHVFWPGGTVTYYPIWQRIITDGNVNLVFVGAPEGFMDTAIAKLDISATMPFEIESGTNRLLHAGETEAVVLPSFDEMNDLGQEFDLVFQGWYIRTAWSPATKRLDDPNEIPTDAKITLTPEIWPLGIFPQLWEPYIWIEARWTQM